MTFMKGLRLILARKFNHIIRARALAGHTLTNASERRYFTGNHHQRIVVNVQGGLSPPTVGDLVFLLPFLVSLAV